jgi:hypothetical protein
MSSDGSLISARKRGKEADEKRRGNFFSDAAPRHQSTRLCTVQIATVKAKSEKRKAKSEKRKAPQNRKIENFSEKPSFFRRFAE